jgi:hypothetical protein
MIKIAGFFIVLFSFISIWYGSNGYVAVGVFFLNIGIEYNKKVRSGDNK